MTLAWHSSLQKRLPTPYFSALVERELASVRPGNRRDAASAPGIGDRIAGAIDLLGEAQIGDAERRTERDAEHPACAILPAQRRHPTGRGEYGPLHRSIREVAIGTIRLERQGHSPSIAELKGSLVAVNQHDNLR